MESIKSLIVAGIIIVIIIAGGIFFYEGGISSKHSTIQHNTNPVVTQGQAQKINLKPSIAQSGNQVVTVGQQDISITTKGFFPKLATIRVGTRVKWTNITGSSATVDSGPYPTHTSYPAMNFGRFTNNSSVELVFDKVGTYQYDNDMNPTQTGTIIVQ